MFLDGIALTFILLVVAGLVAAGVCGWTLNQRMFLALVLGVILGCLFKWWQPYAIDNLRISQSVLLFLGQAYFSLLKMLVVPLILTSIIHAVLQLGGHQKGILTRIAWKTVALLLIMTAIASAIGMVVAMELGVGQGMSLPTMTLAPEHQYTGLADALLGMLPSNPVATMVDNNAIGMVIFAVLVGAAGLMLGKDNPEKLAPFQNWLQSMFLVMKKLASLVIRLTPYGVFGLMADVMIEQGAQSLQGLLMFALAMYLAMILVLVMHSIILWFLGRQKPWQYYRVAYVPLLVAFSTRSSFGTLPVTEETLAKSLHLRQVTATFVPSVGATMGMNACAGIFPAVLVVMAMNITGQPITVGMIALVMLVNTMASLGISGVPGTAFVAATVTLTTLGLPYSVVGLVQGIDPIIDMGRTAVNVNGTMTAAVVADRTTRNLVTHL